MQSWPLGYSWQLSYASCPSLTPFPNISIINVDMASPATSVVYDPGSVLMSGSYTLSLSGTGTTSQPIPIGASDAAISAAISALSPGSSASAVQSGTPLTSFSFRVVWTFPNYDYPSLVVNASGLTGSSVTTYVNGCNCVGCDGRASLLNVMSTVDRVLRVAAGYVWRRSVVTVEQGSANDLFLAPIPGDYLQVGPIAVVCRGV